MRAAECRARTRAPSRRASPSTPPSRHDSYPRGVPHNTKRVPVEPWTGLTIWPDLMPAPATMTRDFKRRALGYGSAADAIWDPLFEGYWAAVEEGGEGGEAVGA